MIPRRRTMDAEKEPIWQVIRMHLKSQPADIPRRISEGIICSRMRRRSFWSLQRAAIPVSSARSKKKTQELRSSRSRANHSMSGCSGSTRRVRQEYGIQPRRWCRKQLPRQLKIRQNRARRSCRQDRAATSDQDTVRRRNRQWVRRLRLGSKELKNGTPHAIENGKLGGCAGSGECSVRGIHKVPDRLPLVKLFQRTEADHIFG